MRRILRTSIFALTAATVLAGTATLAFTNDRAHAVGSENETVPVLVEDFTHPGAAKISKDREIDLLTGDGNIMLVDCVAGADQIRVKGRGTRGVVNACFSVSGSNGVLSLRIPRVFYIEAVSHRVNASLESEKKTEVVDIEKHDAKPVGEGIINNDPAVLVKLRASL